MQPAGTEILLPRHAGSHLPGMTDAQMRRFRQALESHEAALAQKLCRRDGIHVQKSADPADEAQWELERELNVRALDRDSYLLGAIRWALRRFDVGDYGVCLSCDCEISEKRLAAVPWAVYCIQCQERVDLACDGPERCAALIRQ